jgi:protein-tyrosine-phosphatase/predicted ATP-grasp superfamily ATP-dependent carboligase
VNKKEQPKILILDGHSKAAAAAVLALPTSGTLHVAAIEKDCLCFASPRVSRWLIQPRAVTELRAWIEQLDRAERYDLIIPSTETSLLALKADDLEPALRAKAVLPPEASLDVALDKQRTLELAESLGVPIPRGRRIAADTEPPPCDSWPTVIKPVHSKVALGDETLSLAVRICADAEQRNQALADLLPWSPVLEQEYFRGRGFGVEVLFQHGEPHWWFAHERIHELPITGGASSYRRSIDVPETLREASLALLTRLRWHGVAMVEFKMSDDGDCRLMEINPRLWGSLPLAIAAGVNFPLGLLRIATGQPLGEPPHYRRSHYARDIVKDAHWFEDSLRERRNPLRVAPLGVGDLAALLRPLTGREHWDLFRWREPQMWWRGVRPALDGLRARLRRLVTGARSRAHWRRLAPAWRDGRIADVLVLCRGNAFRGPVVAAILANAIGSVDAVSAGADPTFERAPSEQWLEVVENKTGQNLRLQKPHALDDAAIARAELVLAMDVNSWRSFANTNPEAVRKLVLLGTAAATRPGAPLEIPDPREGDPTTFGAIVTQLQTCIEGLVRQRASPTPFKIRAGTPSQSDSLPG